MSTSLTIHIFAGLFKRLFAFFIDLVLLNISFLILYLFLTFIGYNTFEFHRLFFIIFVFYFALFDSILLNGQTPGKKYLKIEVVTYNGQKPGFLHTLGRAFLTALVYFMPNLLTLFYQNFHAQLQPLAMNLLIASFISLMILSYTVFMAFHPYRQGLHDVLFKTLVTVKDQYQKEHLELSGNIIRLTASYFLTIVITIIVLIVTILTSLYLQIFF